MPARACVVVVLLAACQPSGPLEGPISASTLFAAISHRDVRTVESALALLPAEYREHYVLAFAGQAPQTSSPSNPRVISFGEDAHLIVTFNGHRDQPGFDLLELAEFDEPTARFSYSFITLDGQSKATRSDLDPQRCTVCHGENPRTIFNDYPEWPGFYGSHSDAIAPDSEEMASYRSYSGQAEQHPRYSQLSRRFLPSAESGEPGVGVLSRPNNFYGKLLARRQALRLAEDLLAQEPFRSKLFSYLAWSFHTQLGECPEWAATLDEPVFSKLTRFAQEQTVARYPKREFSWSWSAPEDVPSALERFSLSFSSPEVFTERLRPVTQVSPATGPDERIGYNDGLDEMVMLVTHALVHRLPASDLFTGVSYAEVSAQRGFAARYADGSSPIFDAVLPRARPTAIGCEKLAAAARLEWP